MFSGSLSDILYGTIKEEMQYERQLSSASHDFRESNVRVVLDALGRLGRFIHEFYWALDYW